MRTTGDRLLLVAGGLCLAVIGVVAVILAIRTARRVSVGVRQDVPPTGLNDRLSAAHGTGVPAIAAWSEPRTLERSPVLTAPGLGGLALVIVPGLTLAGGVFFMTVGAPWLTMQQRSAAPAQPIYFSHEVHIEQAGLECEFCHRTADRADTAGFPDVEQCMFCHVVVEDLARVAGRAEYEGQIAKLRKAWQEEKPIDWARVHRLPDHTRFPHDAHIQAGVACATCHGDVANMDLVSQTRSLKMGDCVACHQETGAPTDCVDCHY